MKIYTENIKIRLVQSNCVISEFLEIRIKEHEFYWCVYCDALHTIGYSPINKEEAIKNLKANIERFGLVHYQRKTLKKALIKFGWKKDPFDNYTFEEPNPQVNVS